MFSAWDQTSDTYFVGKDAKFAHGDMSVYYRAFHTIIQKVKERKVKLLSRVQLFVTPWTVAHQAPPYKEFSRQEY